MGKPIKITNRAFLEALAGENWRDVPVSTGDQSWVVYRAEQILGALDSTTANYYTVSTFRPMEDGWLRRVKDRFVEQFALVIDDVGTKIVETELWRVIPPPTYILETSPGNKHFGFKVTNGHDARVMAALVYSIIDDPIINPSGKDPGMVGVTRIVRLPVGANCKPAVMEKNGGKPWPHVLHVWEPGRAYSVEELADWLDVDISEPALARYRDGGSHRRATEAEVGIDPLMKLFDQRGMLIDATPNDNGFVTIRCPWAHEHSDSRDEAGYRPGSGGFQCHHGHCEGKGMKELRAWVEETFTSAERAAALAETFGPVNENDPELLGLVAAMGAIRVEMLKRQAAARDTVVRGAAVDLTKPSEGAGGDDDDGDATDSVTYSEDWLALRFVDVFGAGLRYVPVWGKWKVFDGTCWRDDEKLVTFNAARKVCRAAAAAAETPTDMKRLSSAKTRAAVVNLVQSDPRIVATVRQWDSDLMVLNTPGGVVDLRTGEIRAQTPSDYLSKITSVTPGGDCATFLRFLSRVTGGDSDYIEYLRRVVGYCLTGLTTEDALFFLHGSGANGKSTFLRVIKQILGDYALSSPSSVFTASKYENHPTELARLHNKRLVISSEIEPGQTWAESRIKQLTGGDEVSGRLMRQDFFDFVPQLKLVIAGNHAPGLSDVSEAFRRRFHLLPFTVTIPECERDKDLESKLLAEGGGILQWAIEGCAKWQTIGLKPPPAVTSATSEYLDSQDRVAQWIGAECETRAEATQLLISDARKSYNEWALAHGVELLKRDQFRERMARLGFHQKKVEAGMALPGLVLRADKPAGGKPF